MKSQSLPEAVRHFILKHIDSVPELELLLLLSERMPDVTVAEAAARVYVDETSADELLRRLMDRGFLEKSGEPPRFRYAPRHPEDAQVVREVGDAYRSQLVALATFIHSKASGSVQEFARAFDFKKDR